MKNIYDVILIGAGSAGLFAANRLAGSGLKVLVIDRGDEPEKRKDMNFGVGGAGTFSDGKLNLSHRIGGDPSSFGRSASEVEEYIELVDDIFTEIGVAGGYTGTNDKSFQELMRKAHAVGVDFIYAKQRHIGTDRLHVITNRFYQRLVKKGISFRVNTRIRSIDYQDNIFILSNEKEQFRAESIIAAPGRAGAYWLREQAKKLSIKNMYGPIDVGVRVEFPADIYSEIAKIMYDAKFRLYTKSYDDLVRTFCTNPNGYIVKEEFDDFVLVNGHAKWNSKTNNTNFALLSRVTLTDPVEDTTKYGRDIARLATTIGGGKPILQRLTDFVSGRRSTWDRIAKSAITPTLTDVTPGDIAMAFPQRIVTNLMEGLSVLNQIISGLQSNSTLLYAPEIKFYDTKYTVTPNLETNVNNFFVAGDASGHSRGIIYSAVTGIFAAEGVLKNLGKY
ncbi:MAG: NAD(P)/FAD-dependent oxidoreductase [Candidatus Marinimicrobia bacterium]|nr:NAD(P)/FAD-dependent oxidoreductase [Candidatus Neomarinimicrobiota bacterium]